MEKFLNSNAHTKIAVLWIQSFCIQCIKVVITLKRYGLAAQIFLWARARSCEC